MSRCFVSFVVKLWSTDPDKWPFSPTKLHGAIPIFKNRDCAFLFARIIHKEDLSTMSMKHRHFFILDRTVWRSTTSMDRPENFFRSIASPKHCFRSSGFKICQPGVHHFHDRGCQEGFVLRRQQSDQATPGTWKFWFNWTKTPWTGQTEFGVCEKLFVRPFKWACPESWKSRIWKS